jgi:hypothetical protein
MVLMIDPVARVLGLRDFCRKPQMKIQAGATAYIDFAGYAFKQ